MTSGILLFIVWLSFWYIYNYILLRRRYSTEKKPVFLGILFIMTGILSLVIGGYQEFLDLFRLTTITILVSIILSLISKKETGRILNSFFQIAWLYSFVSITNNNWVLLILIFSIGHLPIFFLEHLKFNAKLLVLFYSVIGGAVISYIFIHTDFTFSIITGIAIHYLTYVFLRPFNKIFKLHIIN